MTKTMQVTYEWGLSCLKLALLWSTVALTPLFAQDVLHEAHDTHDAPPAKLVQDVRDNTKQFFDVNAAVRAGYSPAFGCVTGPDHGAMGIHYVNGNAAPAGEVVLESPTALIYEPVGNLRRLVGVEYIVDAATYLANPHNVPPQLDGQAFQLVASPNRFNLDPFFELHVWAWRDNPQGAFVDWNNNVSCEKQ